MSLKNNYDVLILGCGAAGLSLALRLPQHLSVGLIAKGALKYNSTYRAQGGISAVSSAEDSSETHVQDTLSTGIRLCEPTVVRAVIEEAPLSLSG